MKKLIIAVLCLGMLAWSFTAFAQEPTEEETISFISSKLKTHLKMSTNGENLEPSPLYSYIAIIEAYTHQTGSQDLYTGDVLIRLYWAGYAGSSGKDFPRYEQRIIIKDFGNMSISSDSFGVKIQDPQNIKNINVFHDIVSKRNRRWSDDTAKVYIEFEDKDIARRLEKALEHLQKLHREKYPNERKKEPF